MPRTPAYPDLRSRVSEVQRQIAQKREEASALETKILEGMEMVDRARAAIPDKETHARTLATKAVAAAERPGARVADLVRLGRRAGELHPQR